jgi:hypothetical protein
MTQSSPFYPLLVNIVLATLAVGLPIVMVLAIRFLWDRNLNIGRSKELEKLIWQLHRIASALEHQMNLSFPPVQPGTEEARDLAYLKELAARPAGAATEGAVSAAVSASEAAGRPAAAPAQAAAAEEEGLPPLQRREPSVEAPRAGVNSMFGL